MPCNWLALVMSPVPPLATCADLRELGGGFVFFYTAPISNDIGLVVRMGRGGGSILLTPQMAIACK